MKTFQFKPKLFDTLRQYTKADLTADVMAGIIVGIVALPLAIAFGIASGVSPEKGIVTAIIAGFIVSLLGGSRVQIGGPTGAFIVIVYGVIQQYGEAGLLVATLMAGIILIALGLFRLGAVIKFIPYPIVVGFTSGIAVTIFTTQVADILGLDFRGEQVPGDFVGKWLVYIRHMDSINWWNAAVSVASILIIALTPRVLKKIPGSLVAIVVVTVAVWLLKAYAGVDCIDTIGDRFSIRAELPDAALPALDWEAMPAVRRHSGHGSHCTHHDQHQQRRPHARGGHGARRGAATHLAAIDALGEVYPHGMPGGRADGGGIQHERLAHVQGAAQEPQVGRDGTAHHLPAYGAVRPDGGH